MSKDYIIELRDINKTFGGIYALRDVSFGIERGTCHALVGENGAGKSTLMKVINGIIRSDSGEVLLDGKHTEVKNLHHAEELGIAFVPQELSFVPYFTVAENIFLGDEPRRAGNSLIDWKKLFRQTEELLAELKIDLPARKPASALSVSDQQMMVIARVLSKNAKLIIMDEPTARLGHSEIEALLKYVNYLKEQGKTIIYISHLLEEIFEVCDNITVLRDGQTVGTVPTGEMTQDRLINMMVNREVNTKAQERPERDLGEELFRVDHLQKAGKFDDVSFSVRKGEILGLFGLVGAGRSEAIRAVLGVDKYDSAEILLEGKAVRFNHIGKALEKGIALVPEERRKQGIIPSLPIVRNITIGNLKAFSRGGVINRKKEEEFATRTSEFLNVVCSSVRQNVGDLSGGNQQKVVISKYIDRGIKLFILDEPTRGIDVGAKDQIYKIIEDLAATGVGVIVISSEIPELQLLCDRICVMSDGKVTANLSRKEFIESDTILKHAIGI